MYTRRVALKANPSRVRAMIEELPPLDALALISELAATTLPLMRAAREAGATLQQIGDATNTSRQAVWNRLNEQGGVSD